MTYGWDIHTHTEVVPKPPPLHWTVGPVRPKLIQPTPGPAGTQPAEGSEYTMQLTADQEVTLTISGQDRYGNPVDITGGTVWTSSDEAVVQITSSTPDSAVATAVGPTGTAAVTVSNDVNADGTGDFQGSIAIDVVAGTMAEIEVTPGTPTDKPVVEPH